MYDFGIYGKQVVKTALQKFWRLVLLLYGLTNRRWEIKVGDKIEEGDSIATIETDKASVALEIQDEGTSAICLHNV